MSPWIEIYDNEQVQWHLRQRVRMLGVVAAAYLSIAIVLCAIVAMELLTNQLFPVGAAVLCLGMAAWNATQILHLRNQVWCVKLSPHMVRGYDYRRTPTTISWSTVLAVNVTESNISIESAGGRPLEIPCLFPDFAYVSHRIVDLAELHRVPVHVNGRALAETDLFSLLPELRYCLAGPSVAGSSA